MDIAAFKVSHCAGTDQDATALRVARTSSSYRGALALCTSWVEQRTHYSSHVVVNVAISQIC